MNQQKKQNFIKRKEEKERKLAAYRNGESIDLSKCTDEEILAIFQHAFGKDKIVGFVNDHDKEQVNNSLNNLTEKNMTENTNENVRAYELKVVVCSRCFGNIAEPKEPIAIKSLGTSLYLTCFKCGEIIM